MTAFHTARSAEAGKGTVDGVTTQSLLQTSADSWAETDLTLKEPVELDEGKDRKGPISLGAVATIKASPAPSPSPAAPPSPAASASPGASPSPSASPDEPPAPAEGRVVVLGDSDFASNGLLGFQGNQDFFLNPWRGWLRTRACPSREPDQMFLTQQQRRTCSSSPCCSSGHLRGAGHRDLVEATRINSRFLEGTRSWPWPSAWGLRLFRRIQEGSAHKARRRSSHSTRPRELTWRADKPRVKLVRTAPPGVSRRPGRPADGQEAGRC